MRFRCWVFPADQRTGKHQRIQVTGNLSKRLQPRASSSAFCCSAAFCTYSLNIAIFIDVDDDDDARLEYRTRAGVDSFLIHTRLDFIHDLSPLPSPNLLRCISHAIEIEMNVHTNSEYYKWKILSLMNEYQFTHRILNFKFESYNNTAHSAARQYHRLYVYGISVFITVQCSIKTNDGCFQTFQEL